MGILNICR